MTTTLAAALAYAAHGWPAFGVPPTPRKLPHKNCSACPDASCAGRCGHPYCHGFYAATTDAERLREWWARFPADLVAIRTGEPSGLVVVDVDPRNGGQATLAKLDEERLLPGTVMAMTGSGGLHLLYAHPGGWVPSGANRLGPGVDVKADGAYVIAAPSAHPVTGQRYQWSGDGTWQHRLPPLPGPLLARIRPERPTRPAVPLRPAHGNVRGRLAGLVQLVLDATEGERNARLHWAACRAGEMVAAGEVDEQVVVDVLHRAALEVGLTSSEAVGAGYGGTIHSGLRAGRTAA